VNDALEPLPPLAVLPPHSSGSVAAGNGIAATLEPVEAGAVAEGELVGVGVGAAGEGAPLPSPPVPLFTGAPLPFAPPIVAPSPPHAKRSAVTIAAANFRRSRKSPKAGEI